MLTMKDLYYKSFEWLSKFTSTQDYKLLQIFNFRNSVEDFQLLSATDFNAIYM